MRKSLTIIALMAAAIGGTLYWAWAARETPEQQAARRNLEILDALEAAWERRFDYPIDPNYSVIDERQLRPLLNDLRRVDVSGASEEVLAIRERYLRIIEEAPNVLAELAAGPPVEERAPGSLTRPENDAWWANLRNAGIRIELLEEENEKETARLRGKLRRVLKNR